MTALTFKLADPIRHHDKLLELNVEYMTWNAVEIEKEYGLSVPDILGMPVPEYVASVIDKVCGDPPPEGSFYLVEFDGQTVGMGGIRRVRERICELKRVYVRPTYRGKRIGRSIVERAIADAVAFRFTSMVLDSGPFMRSAHRIYEAAGFIDCKPYPEAEVPAILHNGWRFMEIQLGTRQLNLACASVASTVSSQPTQWGGSTRLCRNPRAFPEPLRLLGRRRLTRCLSEAVPICQP